MKRYSLKKHYNIKKKNRNSRMKGGMPTIEDNVCEEIFEFTGDSKFSSAFHPTNHLIATASGKLLKLWRKYRTTDQYDCVATIDNKIDINELIFHPSAPLLLAISDTEIKIWNLSYHQAWFWNFDLFWSLEEYEPDPPFIKLVLKGKIDKVEFHPKIPIIAISYINISHLDIYLLSNADFSDFVISENNITHLWEFNRPEMSQPVLSANHVFTYKPSNDHNALKFAFVPSSNPPLIVIGSRVSLLELYRITLQNWSFNLVWQHQIITTEPNYMFFDPHSIFGSTADSIRIEQIYRTTILCIAVHPTAPIMVVGCDDKTIRLVHMSDDNSSVVFHTEITIETNRNLLYISFHPTLPMLVGIVKHTNAYHKKEIVFWLISKDMRSATYITNKAYINESLNDSFALYPSLPLILINNNNKAKLLRCKLLDPNFPGYILFTKYTDIIDHDVCNLLCPMCNFNICNRNASNTNNINGYVVSLYTNEKNCFIHYNCLHRFLKDGKTEINEIKIQIDTIKALLNIEDKSNAMIGADFYNDTQSIGEHIKYKIENHEDLWRLRILIISSKMAKIKKEQQELDMRERQLAQQELVRIEEQRDKQRRELEEDTQMYD